MRKPHAITAKYLSGIFPASAAVTKRPLATSEAPTPKRFHFACRIALVTDFTIGHFRLWCCKVSQQWLLETFRPLPQFNQS
jgi:hypothetical protein